MGDCGGDSDDGGGVAGVVVGGQRDAILIGDVRLQLRLQRLLQRLPAHFILGNELNQPRLHPHGIINRLGIRPDHNRLTLLLGLQLASNLLLHLPPYVYSHLLRLQVHALITTLPRR